MSDVVLITISGQDRAGLTSALTGILSKYEINVLDIGQSVIHESLSLGILIESPEERLKLLLFQNTPRSKIFYLKRMNLI